MTGDQPQGGAIQDVKDAFANDLKRGNPVVNAPVTAPASSGPPQTDPTRGTYGNLASRRINAGTAIASPGATSPGLGNVRDAALYAQATLALPVNSSTSPRYNQIIGVLDDVNQNKIEVY